MDKKIEEHRTSDLEEFLGSLREGKPIVIYDGFLCGCRSGVGRRRREVEEVIASSDSKIIGKLFCGSIDIPDKRSAKEKGKFFVSGTCKTVDDIVDELTSDYQRELACEIFKDVFGYRADKLSETCPFVEMFVDPSDVAESEKKFIYIDERLGGSMHPEVDYSRLLTEMDKAFSEGRIMMLDELSWYLRKGEGDDRKIYLSTSHHKVKGGYVLKGDKVEGKARCKHGFTFRHFDEDLKKLIKEHGFDLYSMTYQIDAKVDPEYVGKELRGTVYTSRDEVEFSLHGDVKKTKEYYEGIKGRIKEALGIREHYKKLVEDLLEEC